MTWKAVLPIAGFPEEGVAGVAIDGLDIAVFRVDDRFFATSNICTHAYARLCDGYFEGTVVECPLHQASFDVKTGQAINGPARTSLDTYPTRISKEWIELDIPDS